MRNNLSFINVYENKDLKSKISTQLLYGETFKVLKNGKSWIKIKNNLDNYVGYIKNEKFIAKQKNTHKVCNLYANLYSKPNEKNKIKKKLSFGSRIKITKKKNKYYKFENFWIKKKDLKKSQYKKKNIFIDVKKFLNFKYKWGGKHFTGVDCSGLIQLFFNFNNKFCPRDSKDQIVYFKKNVIFKNIKKHDLIFWKGHVALVISKNKLIHAYGPLKKVIVMPIKETIKKIKETAKLEVIGIRRFT